MGNEPIYGCWFPVRKRRLGVPQQVIGAFTNTAELLHCFESSSVMATKAIVPLCIPDDEGNIGVEYYWVDSVIVM